MSRKITYIAMTLHLGGAERMVYEFATHFHRQGDEVEVITLDPLPLEQQPYAAMLAQQGIEVVHVPKQTKLGVGMYEALLEYLRRTHPTIVHTNLTAPDIWGGYAAYRAHVPVVISTEHNVNLDEGRILRWLKARVHRTMDAVVPVSKAVAEYVRETSPAGAEKIEQISNGIRLDAFLEVEPAYDQPATPVISVLGRLEPQKGHMDFLHALAQLKQPFHCRIVGSGSLRGELTEYIQEMDLDEYVQLVPAHTEVAKEYAAADIVVVPSRWEGFGLVAVEAMASGCAVVASHVHGLSELIDDNKTGRLVDIQDTTRFAAVLDELLQDADQRKRLGTAARKAAKEQYDIEQMLAAYDALYDKWIAHEVK